MNDHKHIEDGEALSLSSKRTAAAGLAMAWMLGMSGLIYGTHPEPVEAAIFTTATADETAELNTPVLAIPATSSTSTQTNLNASPAPASANSDLTLLKAPEAVDFIVRFENDIPELDACSKTFRQDKEAAKKMFADWAATQTALDGISLKKVSYSGEMILTWETGINRPILRVEVEAKLAEIKALSSVRYADPDHRAQAEGGR